MKGKNLLLSLLAVFSGIAITVHAQQAGSPEKMTYLQKARVNQETGKINPEDVLKARDQMANMSASRALNLDWIEGGPDNFGGFVSAVLIDNQDESGKTMYAGAFTGGIWKTTNGGLVWNKINHETKNLFVSSFAQAEDGTIYASTGIKDRFIGQGLYKSENGEDFTLLPATEPNHKDSEAPWSYTQKVVIDEGTVYAATNDGLMVSTDNGSSWEKAATSDEELSGFTCDVEISGNGIIYTFIDGEAYHSEGAVNGFNMISGSADSLLPSGEARIRFAAAPTTPEIVYALVIDSDGFMEGVYKSENNGIEWHVVGPGGSDLFRPFESTNDSEGTGLESGAIAVAPDDENEIFIGGTYVYRGVNPQDGGYYAWEKPFAIATPTLPFNIQSFHFATPNKFFVASEYGIASFNTATSEYISYNKFLNISSLNSVSVGINEKVLVGENKYGVLYFPMFEAVEQDAEQVLPGRGGLVEQSILSEENIIISLEAVQGTQEQMFRSQDNGTAFGQNFLKEEMGYSGDTEYDAEFIQFELWESFDNPYSEETVYFKADEDTSYNAGDKVYVQSKTVGYPIEYTLESNLNSGDSVQVADPVAARLFVAIESSNEAQLWMTPEVHKYGVEPVWYQIAQFADDEVPSDVEVSDDGNQVYVGMETGVVYRMNNVAMANDSATAMFDSPESVITNDTIFVMEDRMITSVSVDPNDNDHVIVTLGNYGNEDYVYETFNATADEPSFESIQYNLPNVPVFSSLVEMNNSNHVLVGSEFGIFSLEGDTWTLDAGEMGAVPVTEIRQQVDNSESITIPVGELAGETVYRTYKGISNYGVIFASTYGRGMWKSRNFVGVDEIEAGNGEAQGNTLAMYPNPAVDKVTIELNEEMNDKTVIRILDMQGRVVLEKQASAQGKTASVEIGFLKPGQYMVRTTAGNQTETGKLIVR
ncbi:MAG: T9SS type A sorting domain-containing protein [Bacteroidota bacterium]